VSSRAHAVVTQWRAQAGTGALWRFAALSVTVALLVLGALEAAVVVPLAFSHSGTIGMDFTIYLERTHSWLAGNGFYLPWQLSGPYAIGDGTYPALYPPVLLYLTVPFTMLPAVLWWAVPLGIIGWSLRRAPWWTWPLLAALFIYPRTWLVLLYGNPSLWAFAALAAGAGPLAMLKPTLGPFALVGIRQRAWWRWAFVGLLACVPFALMWPDYLTAVTNAKGGLEYLLGEWPIAAVLVVIDPRPARSRS
jgi:hypothetical protein